MNTLVIVLIAAVCLVAAYALYGRWLAKSWGIDPKAVTPAHRFQDGKDYVPTDGWTVFSHQFSSIAGAGPVTGAIQAAAFGWLPVLLWILIGGIFFGAVTDFGALYASVKNDGKSMGLLIEKYIGKFGRKVFLLFCWLFTLLVIAAFADMVAGTFTAYETVDGVTQLSAAAQTNGAAGCISLFFILFAMILGLVQKKFRLTGWREVAAGLACTVAALALGMLLPITLGKDAWLYITFIYIFFAATLPMWLLKQPRDFMTTFMFVGMIAGAVLGLLVAHPTMNLKAYTGFDNASLGTLFPILFVTVACGAVSGFHSLVSSGTSSKTIDNERDMPKVGYGAMVLESLLAVLALCVAGAAAAADGTPAAGTPFQIFSTGVAGFFEMFGVPVYVAQCFMTMCVSALALTSLDAVARIGRMSFPGTVQRGRHEKRRGLAQGALQHLLCHHRHAGLRLCAGQDRLLQHLAAVRLGQPAAQRAGAGHPVRLYEGHRPQQQDAVPAAGHHAVRYLHRAGAAADRPGAGGGRRQRQLLGRGPAADHRGAADRPGPDHRGQLGQSLRFLPQKRRDGERQGVTA